MAQVYLQCLLLLVLLMDISGCSDTPPAIDTVSASQEEDVALPCFNSSGMDPKNLRVRWTKSATDPSQTKVIFAWPTAGMYNSVDRAKWEADRNGQMSLFLTKLQKSDEGLYRCEIWQGWDRILDKTISLKVKACQILLPVKGKLSTSIRLNCPVDMTEGPQNISWVMLKGLKPVPVNSKKVEINGTSLAIQSMSSNDSGWYRCMPGQNRRCFDINLLVQENAVAATTAPALTTTEINLKSKEEEGSGALIPVVVSVIVVIAVITALMGLFVYSRRNTQTAAQYTQRGPAGTAMVSSGSYEDIMTLRTPEDPTNPRVNSLYQQFDDEGLCTFQY